MAGGGHAHLFVLEALTQFRPSDLEIILVTPSRWQYYSGMLPGWICGAYGKEDCRIDLLPLVRAAGASLQQAYVAGIDPENRLVRLSDGAQLSYDVLSLDVGGEADSSWLASLGRRLVPVKPLEAFMATWEEIVSSARGGKPTSLAIVGSGAAGIELTLTTKRALDSLPAMNEVTLITGNTEILAGHAPSVRKHALAQLAQLGISLIEGRALGSSKGLLLANGGYLEVDHVIAATGSRAPIWLKSSRIQLDDQGYVSVDDFNRSVSHGNIFAAGDISSRDTPYFGRSGAHAVHAGPILANNLIAALQGGAFRTYRPRRHTLYLIAAGDRRAIASWGNWSAQGHWIWRWKDFIDRRFMRRFSVSPSLPGLRNSRKLRP